MLEKLARDWNEDPDINSIFLKDDAMPYGRLRFRCIGFDWIDPDSLANCHRYCYSYISIITIFATMLDPVAVPVVAKAIQHVEPAQAWLGMNISEWSSWVQAVGSILAIAVGFWITNMTWRREQNKDRAQQAAIHYNVSKRLLLLATKVNESFEKIDPDESTVLNTEEIWKHHALLRLIREELASMLPDALNPELLDRCMILFDVLLKIEHEFEIAEKAGKGFIPESDVVAAVRVQSAWLKNFEIDTSIMCTRFSVLASKN